MKNLHNYLKMVEQLIEKQDTVMRNAVPAKTKLEICLRFLAIGDNYASLKYFFRVPKNIISLFIPDVLGAIYKVLQQYIKVVNISGVSPVMLK